MAKSFRGKDVDMIALEKANANKVALGNAHMNTRGDILGRGGIIVKTREDQLKEWQNKVIEETPLVEKNNNIDIEKEIKELNKPIAKTNKKAKKEEQEIIFDDEIEQNKEQ